MQFPTTEPVRLIDQLDVASLLSYLRRESRERPVVILTVGPGRHVPYVSADEIARAGGGRVDVVIIPTEELTRSFSSGLQDERAGVYRGACRVYPIGTAWEGNPLAFPLRFARTQDEIDDLPPLLLEDMRRELARPPRPAPTIPHTPIPARPPAVAGAVPAPAPVRLPTAIATEPDAQALATHLRSPGRERPSVVVSRATGTTEAYANVEELRTVLAGLADVFEITTLDASWAFSRAVPDMCQVYGGASRVYPVGLDWLENPFGSPLRFAYGMPDRQKVTRELVADAMSMASKGNHATAVRTATYLSVTGEVTGVAGERAFVKLANGEIATLWPELVQSGLPAERIFAKGMKVNGELDPDSRRIDVTGMRRPAHEAIAAYRPGDTILARVVQVASDLCTVELFPGLTRSIPAQDVTEESVDLRWLMTAGEVLPLWFGGHEGDEWLLSVPDAADAAAAVPTPSILDGGPPWLVPSVPSEPDTQPVPLHVATREGLSTLQPTQQVIDQLLRENEQLANLLKQAEGQLKTAQTQLKTARTERRETARRKHAGDAPDDSRLFESDRDQLSFEVRQAWARMTVPAEKKDRPLTRWTYGERFVETLNELQGVPRSKIVEVIVHILTGRDTELDSRDLHQLRTGPGGDDPPVVRGGGETCWRASLQTRTPGARRLHYWRRADGSIELSSVRHHDDFRP